MKEKIIKEWENSIYRRPGDKIIILDEPSGIFDLPFVVKKRERALEVIRKCGIPKFD